MRFQQSKISIVFPQKMPYNGKNYLFEHLSIFSSWFLLDTSNKYVAWICIDYYIMSQQYKYNLMKGKVSVNPVFENYGIYSPTVYNTHPLIASDNHRLYFKSQTISTKWPYKSIISCCYSQRYGCILVLSEQGRLHIYTENLQQIARIPWQSKYSVGLQLIDSLNMFLMIGATQLQIQYVRISSNINKTKFVSSMTFTIERRDKYICEPQTRLQWHKGYNYDIKCNLLYLWSSKDINFYSLDKLKLYSHIPSLTRKDIAITYVLYNAYYKYTITGLINGHMKVWRLNEMKNIAKDYIMIHNFIHHQKQIEKIVQGSDERVIISSSSELIVCLWTLETFQQLREYSFGGEYTRIILHNSVYSFALRDSYLGELRFGKTMEYITEIASEIIFFDKSYGQPQLGEYKPVQSLQLTLGSNMGFRIHDEQLNQKDLNKIEIENVYPPLKAKGILQIISSPYAPNQFYLLVENGEVFKLRIEDGSGRIQETYNIERAKDIEMHQLNQHPTIIKFLPFVPPQFDSEINQNIIQKKQVEQVDKKQVFKDLKLICVGCNKGAIVFLRTYNFQKIYTRVTYHREAITSLQNFNSNGFSYIATLCLQKYLKIVKFDDEKALCIFSLYAGDTIKWIRGFEDRLALVMPKGIFQIFQFDSGDEDRCIPNSKNQDHEEQILSLDHDPMNKLIVTAAADNCLKIWTYNKVLMYEITLDEGLKSAIWFRNFEMLISHNLKVLYFKNIGLSIHQKEIQQANEIALEEAEENISIIQLINRVNAIKEQPKFEIIHHQYTPPRPQKINQSFQGKIKNTSIHNSPKKPSSKRQNVKKNSRKIKHRSMVMQQEQKPSHQIVQSDLDAVRKHMNDIKHLRKQTNESILPKIKPKNEDAFDNFMKAKLLNKKILTRRDITLNRIIMKNIIRQHFGNDSEITNNLKLDF